MKEKETFMRKKADIKIFGFFAVISMLFLWGLGFSIPVSADEVGGNTPVDKDVNGAFFNFIYNDIQGEAELSGYTGLETKVEIPASVEFNGKTYKVTSIAANAFAGAKITAVAIPGSVISIGADAFKDCDSLTTVYGEKGSVAESFCAEQNLHFISTSLADTAISLSYTSCIYTGKEKKPEVTVSYNGIALQENIDYTLTYSNNTNPGIANVTINGKGFVKGGVVKKFSIKTKTTAIKNCTFATLKNQIYTGKTITPSVTVKDGNIVLTKNKDYTISYQNNKSIGKATVTIKGIGTYNGTKILNFKIIPQSIIGLKTTNITANSIKLSWKKTAGNDGYRIYKYNSSSKTWKCIAKTKQGTNSYTVTGLSSATTYLFKVRGYKAVGSSIYYGNYSSDVKQCTKPGKAVIKSVVKVSNTSIKVKWNKISGATGYILQYSASKNFSSSIYSIKVTGASTVAKTIKNLKKNKKYYVRVRAYKEFKSSTYVGSYSNVMSTGYSQILVTYSSPYVNNANRTTNLRLAAKAINGTVLAPGEIFSFNGIVGIRTAAKGYKKATIFTGGSSTAQSVGGGICQVASTLFNAALLTNMSIVERHQHSQRVAYVPLGRDAAIYWGSEDFKFKNTTGVNVKVNVVVEGGYVKVTFLADQYVKLPKVSLSVKSSGRTYTLKRTVKGKVNYTTKSTY